MEGLLIGTQQYGDKELRSSYRIGQNVNLDIFRIRSTDSAASFCHLQVGKRSEERSNVLVILRPRY